jgi:hypothetical protein
VGVGVGARAARGDLVGVESNAELPAAHLVRS